MATEVQKIMQANREGVNFGMQIGAGAMRELVLKLPGMTEELADQVRAIDIDKIKVKR